MSAPHENETLPQLERQPQTAPGINRAEPAAGPPAIRTGPMTTPVVPPPNERPQVVRRRSSARRCRSSASNCPSSGSNQSSLRRRLRRPLLQTAPRVVPNVQQRSAAPAAGTAGPLDDVVSTRSSDDGDGTQEPLPPDTSDVVDPFNKKAPEDAEGFSSR
jgi:hypothetical protein